ncbi:hypothetical protein DAI22_04g160201 [Oryza sativa Japonica Group]|nr:hypothetical protein DAI22_04g160201 [Oryza sativa Japonica Group]
MWPPRQRIATFLLPRRSLRPPPTGWRGPRGDERQIRRRPAARRKTAAATTPSSTVEAQHRSCPAAGPANATGARGGRASGAPPGGRRRRRAADLGRLPERPLLRRAPRSDGELPDGFSLSCFSWSCFFFFLTKVAEVRVAKLGHAKLLGRVPTPLSPPATWRLAPPPTYIKQLMRV